MAHKPTDILKNKIMAIEHVEKKYMYQVTNICVLGIESLVSGYLINALNNVQVSLPTHFPIYGQQPGLTGDSPTDCVRN